MIERHAWRLEHQDLVFPGNLREIMNQVLEVERRAEAQLIEARREAEVTRIKAEAESAALRAKLEIQREQIRSAAEAERDRQRLRLAWELEEARAIREAPELLKLREMATLAEMAKAGGTFVVGMSGAALAKALADDR